MSSSTVTVSAVVFAVIIVVIVVVIIYTEPLHSSQMGRVRCNQSWRQPQNTGHVSPSPQHTAALWGHRYQPPISQRETEVQKAVAQPHLDGHWQSQTLLWSRFQTPQCPCDPPVPSPIHLLAPRGPHSKTHPCPGNQQIRNCLVGAACCPALGDKKSHFEE